MNINILLTYIYLTKRCSWVKKMLIFWTNQRRERRLKSRPSLDGKIIRKTKPILITNQIKDYSQTQGLTRHLIYWVKKKTILIHPLNIKIKSRTRTRIIKNLSLIGMSSTKWIICKILLIQWMRKKISWKYSRACWGEDQTNRKSFNWVLKIV